MTGTPLPLIIGVDGGGTKTAARVASVRPDGGIVVLGEGHGGPSNVRAVGPVHAKTNLDVAIDAAHEAAGTRDVAVDYAVLALAGSAHRRQQFQHLQAHVRAMVVGDDAVGITGLDAGGDRVGVGRIHRVDVVPKQVAAAAGTRRVLEIVDEDRVDLVATGGNAEEGGTEEHPWVIRSGNLTHLVELPFHFIDRNELYLVYADLYYDMLAPETEGSQRAAVRLEDVNAESSPEQLRAIADYLHDEGVPFQVAVIPIMIDRTPDEEDFYGLSLLDSPDVVEAMKYMQQRGGTLIQHGTSHQYGAAKNPYSGRSGDDYEFYGYGCSATELPPYEWEPCENSSWVRKKDPLPEDDVDAHRDRLDHGREIMIEAGLGEPKIFETPHYTASVNAYVAMAEEYDARYEQVEYYAGMLSGGEFTSENSYGQIFPYSVHDIYGSTVYPENLQNPTEKEQNNHPARPPKEIVARAEANLAVTESTASFYFHPFLEIEYLAEVVDGIKDLGYEFVPVTELE